MSNVSKAPEGPQENLVGLTAYLQLQWNAPELEERPTADSYDLTQ